MIKQTIKYKDYNNKDQTDDFMFNLSKGELVLMQLAAVDQNTESLQDKLEKIGKYLQGKELADLFEEIILSAYGEKSVDGTRFIKDPELTKRFKSTGAYSELVVNMITDADYAAKFVNGLMPENLRDEVNKEVASVREKSEAKMQGFQQKQAPATQTVPELPTSAPVLESDVEKKEDLSSLPHEELVRRLSGQ